MTSEAELRQHIAAVISEIDQLEHVRKTRNSWSAALSLRKRLQNCLDLPVLSLDTLRDRAYGLFRISDDYLVPRVTLRKSILSLSDHFDQLAKEIQAAKSPPATTLTSRSSKASTRPKAPQRAPTKTSRKKATKKATPVKKVAPTKQAATRQRPVPQTKKAKRS